VDPNFEELRTQISALAPPSSPDARSVYWVRDASLGIAVDPRGAFEVFLVAPQIAPRSPLVSRHLEFDTWVSGDDGAFLANRLVFPAAPHFLAFSALVAQELVRAGWGNSEMNQADAFHTVEPLIEMALRRAALSEETIVGLIGELLLLDQMLEAVVTTNPELRSAILDMWRGHLREARDFVVGRSAIEVKTTLRSASEHHIHGLSQVEQNGLDEDQVLILSIGLAAGSEGFTLPDTVERILGKLMDVAGAPLRARFLGEVARYAQDAGLGYVHDVMRAWPVYQAAYVMSFVPRLYDMSDPSVRVVRRSDLVGTFVVPERIEYQVRLPPRITALNPREDWQDVVRSMVLRAVGLV
jgi:hypothetical protein